jgi:hypothetical protein
LPPKIIKDVVYSFEDFFKFWKKRGKRTIETTVLDKLEVIIYGPDVRFEICHSFEKQDSIIPDFTSVTYHLDSKYDQAPSIGKVSVLKAKKTFVTAETKKKLAQLEKTCPHKSKDDKKHDWCFEKFENNRGNGLMNYDKAIKLIPNCVFVEIDQLAEDDTLAPKF